jgi:hypothetical protein
MGWKATGEPTVPRHRDKWVVRVDGIDTETGRARPRQVGTYPSQRPHAVGGDASFVVADFETVVLEVGDAGAHTDVEYVLDDASCCGVGLDPCGADRLLHLKVAS